MDKFQRDVQQFHWACGLRAPNAPVFEDKEGLAMRVRLIDEEVQELKDAIDDRDPLEVIDALCDILYVTYGFAVAEGIDLEPFWREVQRANMQKTTGPKREDGKQLKPEGWNPPRHHEVFRVAYNMGHHNVIWPH